MLFGEAEDKVDRLNAVTTLLLDGTSSVDAVTKVYGSIETLEQGYIKYLQKPLFPFARLKAETRILAKDFASRTVGAIPRRLGDVPPFTRPWAARWKHEP